MAKTLCRCRLELVHPDMSPGRDVVRPALITAVVSLRRPQPAGLPCEECDGLHFPPTVNVPPVSSHSADAAGLAAMRLIRGQLPFHAGNAVNRERSAGAVFDMRQPPGQHCPEQPSSRLRNNVGHRRVSAVEEELPSCQHHR